ncbi:MAG TPA: hypothetical protein PKE04_00975 [Clostridia bacterium]|nr:hypothetical protein [Clostridia bacterium]
MGKRRIALAWMLCLGLLCASGWAGAAPEGSEYRVDDLGMVIAAPEDWVVDDDQTLQRINVMQMDDKLTHPTLLMSQAKQDVDGLLRIELSMERTKAFSSAIVYAAALLVDSDQMFMQLGEKPRYEALTWPELDWPGISIQSGETVWIYWVAQTEDGFYTLQISYPCAHPEYGEQIRGLIRMER